MESQLSESQLSESTKSLNSLNSLPSTLNIEKATLIIETFLRNNNLYEFLSADPNIYIGGSLPFMCLSPIIHNFTIKTSSEIDDIDICTTNCPALINCEIKPSIEIGDIDIYTTNCPLLMRNIRKTFEPHSIVKTGVNIKFEIDETNIPIQIITSPFTDFKAEVLDEYDCGMVSVGYHPFSSKFVIHDNFIDQYNQGKFIVIHERSNPSRVKKLEKRAKELFGLPLVEQRLDENTDYRPYWKNKVKVDSIHDVMPSPPYTQLYANKYHCVGCKRKQEYLVCAVCKLRLNNAFDHTIKINNFTNKYKKVVVFGGLNGLGKIIADEIVQVYIDAKSINYNVVRTGRNGTNTNNTYKFDMSAYVDKLTKVNDITKNNFYRYNKSSVIKNKTNQVLSKELLKKISEADLIIFNAYQTLENDQTVWTTNINTFDTDLSEDRFKTNCWGYVGLMQEIINERKKQIFTQDQVFVWMDANESKFETKLSDGKHLELNMAKTACKQIFYTNATVLASLGIICICYCPSWLSYHGISVDKIAPKSKYLVPPSLSAKALISYVSKLDINQLYEEKKFIHDMTFYKCAENSGVDFFAELDHDEIDQLNELNKLNKLNESNNTVIKSSIYDESESDTESKTELASNIIDIDYIEVPPKKKMAEKSNSNAKPKIEYKSESESESESDEEIVEVLPKKKLVKKKIITDQQTNQQTNQPIDQENDALTLVYQGIQITVKKLTK